MEKEKIYTPDQFNQTTGDYIGISTPVKFTILADGKRLPYFAGVQTTSGIPAIIVQPVSITVLAGSYGSIFSVQATSPGGGSETQYNWYKIVYILLQELMFSMQRQILL
jgi:hypothetical protein